MFEESDNDNNTTTDIDEVVTHLCYENGSLVEPIQPIEGVDLTGPIRIPDTGGWTVLKMIAHKGVELKKGIHTIRAVMDEVGPSNSIGDIDYFKFTRIE